MLQINTGKLFANGVGRTNSLRGVLYSNIDLMLTRDIQTLAGNLRKTGGQNSRAVVYELEERIEKCEDGAGVLVSHCVDPYLYDFAAVASFGLNVTMSPNSSLVHRLTSGELNLSSYDTPDKFLKSCFDKKIYIKDEEVSEFELFVQELLGLERKRYLCVMRAIKSYVTGTHRIADDLSLAYTLMVTAVEALAQNFDGHISTWEDVNEKKRVPIDRILNKIENTTAAEIREVIRSVEHVSLASRYREFVAHYIDEAFYRTEEATQTLSIARYELKEVLKNAYSIRSKYVHNLLVLPDEIKIPFDLREVAYVERSPTLTMQGLARLTRYVIKSFVKKSPKVEKEIYNYTREEAGIMIVQMAPQYWIAKPLRNAEEAPRRLEAFFQQLLTLLDKEKQPELTDIRPVLQEIEKLIGQASPKFKPSMLLLHALFNFFVNHEQRTLGYLDFCKKHEHILKGDTPEQLIALTIVKNTDHWTVETHQSLHDKYFQQCVKKNGFHAPRELETAATLHLAERYRLLGEETTAKKLISFALDNYPRCKALHALEKDFNSEYLIDWNKILFPDKQKKPT